MAHASIKTYCIGLGLALACTLASFGVVWARTAGYSAWPLGLVIGAIVVLAVVQFGVQLVYFLHLGRTAAAGPNVAMFALAAVLVFILVGGSLWIMTSLNGRMMPSRTQMLQYMQSQSAAL